jgi:plasmid maintenance system antidote protein VapI
MGPSTQLSGGPAQRAMPFFAEVRKPIKVEPALLRTCDTMLDAIHLCIHLAKLPHYAIADRLGIDKGHWTRMMQSQAHFPPNKLKHLMDVCQNFAPMQWLAMQTGFDLYEDPKAKRREELRRELELLDEQAA